MCLAIPMKVTKIEDRIAYAEVGGTEYQANIGLMEDLKVGEYIIVHAGFAIEKLDEESALESLQVWQEIADSEQ
ncbi:MAG: HypC/HybG/HupF family hydrogenase formation chaperone [Candidatus Marinimicrobia bacterium]|nr:HypC/HybG/HupF family hydrogenase formation chaperone [Candidatus Neomarinimicrobiota bacterium]